MATPLRGKLQLTQSLWALALISCAVPAHPQPTQPEAQTLQVGEWYTVTCPRPFPMDTVAEITVAYKGIAEKTKLCCDLHYQKTDGSSGGFHANDWRGAPEIQGDGQHTFTVPIRANDDLATVSLIIFTDPNAAWETHTRLATSAPLPVFDADPRYAPWKRDARWNKSWIAFDWATLQKPLTEGDTLAVTVDYYLDPADHYKQTTLSLEALGPRIPKRELGAGPATFAAKLGLSIQLNDSDATNLSAQMNWGGGLTPTWQPPSFGRVTLVE